MARDDNPRAEALFSDARVSAGISTTTVCEYPRGTADIERFVGLERSYPVLVQAGIPTPRTVILSIDDVQATAIDSPEAMRPRGA